MQRRMFLKTGIAGGISLPGLLHLRAATRRTDTAVIVLYSHGGISHIDTKPEAPEEYRGPFKSIQTRSTGYC